MRRALLACLAAHACVALANDEASPELPLKIDERLYSVEAEYVFPHGYAMEFPEILADQQVWGIAHGARLLALTCARHGYPAAAEAWVNWQEREAPEITALTTRLGQHYFRRPDVPLYAIAAALGLRQSLELAPEVRDAACNTLGAALAQERYDLAKRREGLLKK